MGDRWHGMAWHGILAHWHMGGWGKRKWEMRENGTPTDVPKPAPPVALTACLAASWPQLMSWIGTSLCALSDRPVRYGLVDGPNGGRHARPRRASNAAFSSAVLRQLAKPGAWHAARRLSEH